MSALERAHDDQGIMDLGKNCAFCHRLDFLPFHCEFCKGTYCSAHRTLDNHECVGRRQKNAPKTAGIDRASNGPSAASLFPDRARHQKLLDALLESLGTAPARDRKTPLMKLTKFLHLQKLRRDAKKKSSFFGKLASRAVSATAEVAKIKKSAKGPASVNAADRVFMWVLYVNRNEEELEQISVETERRAVWVLKMWSVGRALDSIAETMNIMNHNNATQQSGERLNLFKAEKDEPVVLAASAKVSTSIPNGATLYLVKGAM
ncbi:hypothetical protein METBIDRAFT_42303 [Metschnikowia bicuspidata var. bicuspidata NRRL YB-4993]|uniref:AN1-type domain-containing protein n=1 Tax=Metschnikowia bicuspidata var. bicuspidata NRRL YB-4993 TaxID=869754 RepID=A0A1A0HA80_9ASCO|nr:hypothetical protein METBIDRAFT_42303 [Metschnikowia bicuspidata var. bicuspidata NRRL YB-4993]OBA20910.1 hypothetical protein METBIDRAFT_42303 [Metschnikowia bicuspidata var. bicuspidata NRRL YB-4993]